MKEFPAYAGLVIGERLRLIGPVVRDHIEACLNLGTALLTAVDNWVVANP